MTPATPKVAEEDLVDRGWAALPPAYRMPEVAPSLGEARAYCRRLAETHYENFHVASWFLPPELRPHFHAIYAYCRISDDLADEVGDTAQATALLGRWRRALDACYEGQARHPVFVALGATIRERSIPKEPFADLLTAFEQDQIVTRYPSRTEVLGYCRYSANPVGRLVLYACGYADEERFRLSDATCTALQLANFWQDVAGDYARGRIYLPQDEMKRFGVAEAAIASGQATPDFRSLLRSEVAYARDLFQLGYPLADSVRGRLALDLELFSRGGLAILHAIEERDYDVLSARPSLSKRAKLGLLLRAVAGRSGAWLRRGKAPKGTVA
jgi:squalene synthase HpnC